MSEENQYNNIIETNNTIQQSFEKTFENYNIRCFTINDELYFVAKDIATALKYSNTTETIRKHCPNRKPVSEILGYEHETLTNEIKDLQALNLDPKSIIITEPDMYALVMRSEKETVEPFKQWVYSVIQEIRKTGSYNSFNNNISDNMLDLINNKMTEIVNSSYDNLLSYIDDKFDEKINKLISYKKLGNRNYSFQELVDFINKEYAPPGIQTNITSMKSFLVSISMIKKNGTGVKKYLDNGYITEIVNPFSTAINTNNIVFSKDGIEFIVNQLLDQGYITI